MNPHVSSFLDAKGGVLHSLRSHFGFDLQPLDSKRQPGWVELRQRARMLSEYNLLPSFFGRAMCQVPNGAGNGLKSPGDEASLAGFPGK